MSSSESELRQIWQELGPEEREAVTLLARRILMGQRQYGVLDLANDRRDLRAERSCELQDFLIYSAYAEIQAQTRGLHAPVPRRSRAHAIVRLVCLIMVTGFILAGAMFYPR